MQIICIARGSYSQGKELAEILAGKLGCQSLGREDLLEEATRAGIAVGKLEAAMLKPSIFNERLLLEKEHYHAFATAYLCDMALRANLVYHGRTGHLLLPGISHVLRIGLVENIDKRINAAMTKLNIPRDKARSYIESVDDDMHRWVKTFYGVEWDASSHYDLVVNLEQMSLTNAAAALCSVAALPDFQTTPASRRAMEDLHLAARIRLKLARDERTRTCSFRVLAKQGSVLITYQPRDAKLAATAPEVVRDVDGITELSCTMAATNILWIQEEYSSASETFTQILALARRWNAAVELLRFIPGENDNEVPETAAPPPLPTGQRREYNGGIEDDVADLSVGEDGGLRQTHDSLAEVGVAGGAHTVCCQANRLLDKLDTRVKYSLVVIGDVFLGKGHATQLRKARELASTLSDALRVPVVGANELKKTYMFTAGQAVKLAFYLITVLAVLVLVFRNQGTVVEFVHAQGTHAKLLAAIAVGILVPSFAYLYGTIAKYLLKLAGME
jgi:hypothetical protein